MALVGDLITTKPPSRRKPLKKTFHALGEADRKSAPKGLSPIKGMTVICFESVLNT
jgi:hypothetical protein